MKKILTLVLAVLTLLTMVGCSSSSSETSFNTSTELKDTLTLTYTSDANTLDYLTTQYTIDFQVTANLVDGLLGYDSYGHTVGNLAVDWESNEDQTVWTFYLREGVYWVTSTGEQYAEVTADDFVAAMQHAADFNSQTLYIVQGDGTSDSGLVNLNNYVDGTVTDFSEVGVQAIDTYTVQYTFNDPVSYMESLVTYAIFYPVNRTFLESQGTGCALGNPDVNNCDFGSLSIDSILYNGAFLLSALDSKSQIRFTKNESYYMVDEVYISEVLWVYTGEESDVYATINGFENGTYDEASLSTAWEDFDDYVEKYDGYYYEELSNTSIFNINFNYNRTSYEYTSEGRTEEDKENTRNAILNENFRKAFLAAFDRIAYFSVSVPEVLAEAMLRNFNGSPDIVTTSDGRSYGELVEEAYYEITGETIDLSDGQDPFLDTDAVMEYIAAAEAEGISFPVTLDMAYINNSTEVYVNRAQSLKNSIETNTNGMILINLVGVDIDTFYIFQYYSEDYDDKDYDITYFSGWGPDYADPKTYVDIYSTSAGSFMKTLGLPLDSDDTAETAAIKESTGWSEYEALYRAADAITDDLDARYEAFAMADAYLVAHALIVPGNMQTRSYLVSRIVPFTQQYSQVGLGEYKYVYMKVQEGIVTTEQYEAAYADFEANR